MSFKVIYIGISEKLVSDYLFPYNDFYIDISLTFRKYRDPLPFSTTSLAFYVLSPGKRAKIRTNFTFEKTRISALFFR